MLRHVPRAEDAYEYASLPLEYARIRSMRTALECYTVSTEPIIHPELEHRAQKDQTLGRVSP
jgi:hypothetical protein